MPLHEFAILSMIVEKRTYEESASWKDRLGHKLHFTYATLPSSPIASSPSPLSYIVFCKATAHVWTDGRLGFMQHSRRILVASPCPFIQTFYFPGYVYTNKPCSRVACRENCSSRADPIFPFMTHCPREQSAPRTWMAYIPRNYDASDKLDHAYIGRSLRLNYLNFSYITASCILQW